MAKTYFSWQWDDGRPQPDASMTRRRAAALLRRWRAQRPKIRLTRVCVEATRAYLFENVSSGLRGGLYVTRAAGSQPAGQEISFDDFSGEVDSDPYVREAYFNLGAA